MIRLLLVGMVLLLGACSSQGADDPGGVSLPWLIFGFGAQLVFMMRMVVQWIASERSRRSVVPTAFWWISLMGGASLLTYFLRRGDPVGILGQAIGVFIYTRNLILIHRPATEVPDPSAGVVAKVHRSGGRLTLTVALLLLIASAVIVGSILLVVRGRGRDPLPANVGNRPDRTARLTGDDGTGPYAFIVLGDTRSDGTTAALMARVREDRPAFAVLLGNGTLSGSIGQHRFLRHRFAHGLAASCPVFYAVGDHDVDPAGYSLDDFQRDYGPTNFTVAFRGSLFVVIQTLAAPWDNLATVAFLEDLVRRTDRSAWQHVVVFMSGAPEALVAPTGGRFAQQTAVERLLQQLAADYVFGIDSRGYARCEQADRDLIVVGNEAGSNRQAFVRFPHALVVTVTPTAVTERLVVVLPVNPLGERLTHIAVAEIWPWLEAHVALTIALMFLLFGAAPVGVWWGLRRPRLRPPVPASLSDTPADG